MSEEIKTVKTNPGPKWTNDNTCSTHLEALTRVEKLKEEWIKKKQENMQTKVKRKADGRFIVKYRKDPAFTTKETKNGNSNRKNKRNTSSPKFNADASV